jgi:uncharacterized protein
MKLPLPVTDVDRQFYEKRLKDFLPDVMIDAHSHIWPGNKRDAGDDALQRVVQWPSLVASVNPIEDHLESYRLLFPGKQVTPVVFSNLSNPATIEASNEYVRQAAEEHKLPALLYTLPEWSADEMAQRIRAGGFVGIKVYLNLAPAYLPRREIRIFDYLPHHLLECIDANGGIVMLHIPRDKRLGDPVNLAQMLEIERRYPNVRLIIAHVGRAYCAPDVGDAFEVLKATERMVFDISANCNADVFDRLIQCVGPRRILFGSDLPILRMRTRRICEQGKYINLVPRGLYGDVSADPHMREVTGAEAEQLTFFMYEELEAFRQAAEKNNLTEADLRDIFYNNAKDLIVGTGQFRFEC